LNDFHSALSLPPVPSSSSSSSSSSTSAPLHPPSYSIDISTGVGCSMIKLPKSLIVWHLNLTLVWGIYVHVLLAVKKMIEKSRLLDVDVLLGK
jgi:hypothetical protein